MFDLSYDSRGNIAMISALSLVPLAAVAGFVVDYNRANSHQVALQQAVDLAALSAAKLADPTQQQLNQAVANVVAANFEYATLYPNLSPTVSMVGNDLTVNAGIELDLMMSTGDMDVSASAVVERNHGLDAPLEFSMIMDTTVSMGLISNSWDDAVSAINWTFGELTAGATSQNPANIMFMPISDRVNIGTENADWLAGPAPTNWNGCVEPRYTKETTVTVPVSGNLASDPNASCNGLECTITSYETSGEPDDGFVLDAISHADAKFEASIPGQTGGLSDWGQSWPRCPGAITGPTQNLTELSNAVNSAQATGTGRFDLALAWGWRLVSEDWQDEFGATGFPGAAADTDKMITIVTDSHTVAWDWEAGGSGGNRPGGYAHNTVPDFGFQQIEALCQRIRDDGVEIAVLLTNSYERAKTPWRNCASEDLFFEVDTIADFRMAMASIANRYVDVRLKS
ncbi:MAG: pilus assembly protein TadG-related protein [Pseudomonadota bacterium]